MQRHQNKKTPSKDNSYHCPPPLLFWPKMHQNGDRHAILCCFKDPLGTFLFKIIQICPKKESFSRLTGLPTLNFSVEIFMQLFRHYLIDNFICIVKWTWLFLTSEAMEAVGVHTLALNSMFQSSQSAKPPILKLRPKVLRSTF